MYYRNEFTSFLLFFFLLQNMTASFITLFSPVFYLLYLQQIHYDLRLISKLSRLMFIHSNICLFVCLFFYPCIPLVEGKGFLSCFVLFYSYKYLFYFMLRWLVLEMWLVITEKKEVIRQSLT